jgi:raffinose/stachyose/melibiose transport system permease protein
MAARITAPMDGATPMVTLDSPRRATSPKRRSSRTPNSQRKLQPSGYLWLLPAMVLSVGLVYICIGYTGFISTLDWDGSSPVQTSVGFDNYTKLFQDPVFWLTIWHTIAFFVVTFAVQTALGVVFAVLLHSRVKLGVIYKVIIFIPVVLAPAVMAPVFRQIFAADGQLNWVLDHLGLGALTHPWLADSATALPVIMAITIWQWTGLTFILYFAAMSQIDPEVIEAARIDGAGNIRVIWSIILPGVRGTTIAILMLSVIGALKTFDVPYLVTVGGPNYATEFLGTYIYRQSIPLANVGYGAALSIMLLILAVGFSILVSIRQRRDA